MKGKKDIISLSSQSRILNIIIIYFFKKRRKKKQEKKEEIRMFLEII